MVGNDDVRKFAAVNAETTRKTKVELRSLGKRIEI